MNLLINISLLPLLFIPIIFIMLATLAYMVSRTTNIKKHLHLSLSFIALSIFSFIIYSSIQEPKLIFWGIPFHIASICLILQIVAMIYFTKKFTKKELVPLIIVAILLILSLSFDMFFAGLIVFGGFLVYGIWLIYRSVKLYENSLLRGVVFIALGIFHFIGQWFPFQSGIFLYSILIIFAMLVESGYYFHRVVNMLRAAGLNSIKDPLTKLFNKGFLMRKVEQLLKRQNIDIIFIDIDNFKQLNDTKGHDYGDKVLCKVGAALKDELADKGFACRYGGEEMCGIVMEGDAEKIAEAFRKNVEKSALVTVSVGVASSSEIVEEEGKAMAVIKKADERMYVAKTSGKNQVVSIDN